MVILRNIEINGGNLGTNTGITLNNGRLILENEVFLQYGGTSVLRAVGSNWAQPIRRAAGVNCEPRQNRPQFVPANAGTPGPAARRLALIPAFAGMKS